MKMHCTIAADLLPLYAEGLCSPETTTLLESHLEECTGCKEALTHYRTKLEQSLSCSDEEVRRVNQTEAEPMKKIARELRLGNRSIAWLLIVLLLLLGGAGYLAHGDLTQTHWGFSSIYSYLKCRYVVGQLGRGKVSPLVDAIYLAPNDTRAMLYYYGTNGLKEHSQPLNTVYQAFLEQEIADRWETYYKGKDLEIFYEVYFDETEPKALIPPEIYVTLSEPDTDSSMTFVMQMQGTGYYRVYDLEADEALPELFTAQPDYSDSDQAFYRIGKRYVANSYQQLISGEKRVMTDEEFEAYLQTGETPEEAFLFNSIVLRTLGMSNFTNGHMLELYQAGWYISSSTIETDYYDEERGVWITSYLHRFDHPETNEWFYFSFSRTEDLAQSLLPSGIEITGDTDALTPELKEHLHALIE